MKKLLMVAYYFPPIGGSGTQRSSKFVKYLPRFGWQPTVISGFDATWPQDHTLLADIPPEAQIHRFPLPPTVWRRARHWLFDHRIGPIGLGRIGNYLGWFLDFPDTKREWADTAAEMALEMSKLHEFDAIYTTSPPYSSCAAVRRIQDRLGLPWIADFRDHWSREDIEFGELPKWLRNRHAAAEREVVCHADAVICANEGIAEFFRTTYGLSAERCIVITNGFDQDDFTDTQRQTRKGADVTLTHTGTFPRRLYSPAPLMNALKHYWQGPPDGVERLQMRFIGGIGDALLEKYAGVSVEVSDRVSHPEAVAAQQSADLILLIFDRQVGILPGKLFEYLACGTPIFAVIPTGERAAAANIIHQCNAGWVADCDRPDEIVTKLTEAVATVARPDYRFRPNLPQIAEYSRERLTGRLASFLDELIVSRKA